MVAKRKARRFIETVHNSWTDDFVYRREAYIYRKKWWLTEEQAKALLARLGDVFDNGRVPRLRLCASKRNRMFGSFTPLKGGERIRLFGTGMYRSNLVAWGVNSKCREVKLVYHGVQPFMYPAETLLHEFAHYLAWRWWSDGSHRSAWSSVNEALQEWYARKRGRKGVSYRMTVIYRKVAKEYQA